MKPCIFSSIFKLLFNMKSLDHFNYKYLRENFEKINPNVMKWMNSMKSFVKVYKKWELNSWENTRIINDLRSFGETLNKFQKLYLR